MEEHLTDKIEMDELARIAYLSPFYFQRLFNRLVGKTVMEYIKLRRLANAAGQLPLRAAPAGSFS
jgi:AraC family transcriptional regulator